MKQQPLISIDQATHALIHQLYDWSTYNQRIRGKLDTISLVERIGDSERPAAIPSLLCYGMAPSAEVALASRAAIARLIPGIPFDYLPSFDSTLRQAWKNATHWYGITPAMVRNVKVRNENDRVFLTFCSSYQDGFVREKAIQRMQEDSSPLATAFLLVRLTDWVLEVRTAAERATLRRLDREHASAFVECLGLLDAIAKGSRFSAVYRTWVDDLLKNPECSQALLTGTRSSTRSVRRHSVPLALENPAISRQAVAERALSDPDVVIRTWMHRNGPWLINQGIEWIERAATDAHASIRRIAFDAFADSPALTKEEIARFLLDPNPGIRRACQATYLRRFAEPPSDAYRNALALPRSGPRAAALEGLAETGKPEDGQLAIKMLGDRSARVLRAAIRAVTVLRVENRERMLLPLVRSAIGSVACDALSALFKGCNMPASVLWMESLRNPDRRVSLRMLLLLKNSPKWIQIRIYLEALSIEDPIHRYVIERMRLWLAAYNRSFTQPSPSERDAIRALFDKQAALLPQALAEQISFILHHAVV